MNISRDEASKALAEMKQARVRANELKPLPVAYHLGVGALMGGWVMLPSLPGLWLAFGLAAFSALAFGLYRWQLRSTSRFVNGWRRGKTLAVSLVMLFVAVGFALASNPGVMPTFNLFTPVQGGLMAFVATTVLDWIWVKVYDREMRHAR